MKRIVEFCRGITAARQPDRTWKGGLRARMKRVLVMDRRNDARGLYDSETGASALSR
jgi:hypothetical protein